MVASLSYALRNVLQQREAEQMADEDSLGIGVLTKHADRPRWPVGIGADVAGYVFEALALGAGTLVLVEPILATALFSLLFGAILHGRHVSRAGWLAAILLATSVSSFLYQVSPSGGASVAPIRQWLLAGSVVAAFVFVCVGAGCEANRATTRCGGYCRIGTARRRESKRLLRSGVLCADPAGPSLRSSLRCQLPLLPRSGDATKRLPHRINKVLTVRVLRRPMNSRGADSRDGSVGHGDLVVH